MNLDDVLSGNYSPKELCDGDDEIIAIVKEALDRIGDFVEEYADPEPHFRPTPLAEKLAAFVEEYLVFAVTQNEGQSRHQRHGKFAAALLNTFIHWMLHASPCPWDGPFGHICSLGQKGAEELAVKFSKVAEEKESNRRYGVPDAGAERVSE